MSTTANYTTSSLLLTTGKDGWEPRKNIGVHRMGDGMILVTVRSHDETAAFFLSAHEAAGMARTMLAAAEVNA